MKLVNMTKKTIPTEDNLLHSIWVREYGGFFLPSNLTGGWVLVDMNDPSNGYNGSGDGWVTVMEMWEQLGDQFDKLLPVDTLVLQSVDIMDVSQN